MAYLPRVLAGAWLALSVLSPSIAAAQTETCRPANAGRRESGAHLDAAVDALGLASVGKSVRVAAATDVVSMDYQSDRPYPPYLWNPTQSRVLADRQSATLRVEQGPGGAFAVVSDSTRRAVVSVRGSQLVPVLSPNLIDDRAMDPWILLADWQRAGDVRVEGECRYRDYWRTVLTRGAREDTQRLYLDPKTGFPVKLDRREEHHLWGDVHVEYLWSIWTPVAGTRALAPQFTFRLVEGEVNAQRLMKLFTFADDSVAPLRIPDNVAPLMNAAAVSPPDTVRVGANTFLLRTPSYTNVVTLQRDTVWILDAQINEVRARQDSGWIGRLFPGRHAVAVVVTDLAYPHIGGVRYWVANGAVVISHRQSRDLLRRVVDRKWTMQPDLLARAPRAMKFKAVAEAVTLAGGALSVIPIDGIGSEGALAVYVHSERFLYAGDFIQPGGAASFSATYAREVVAAALRAGISPVAFAAMHVPLTPWDQLSRFGADPLGRK